MCPPSWWLRTQIRPYKTGNYFYSYERNLVSAARGSRSAGTARPTISKANRPVAVRSTHHTMNG
jgi:hypothetical protein